jgi:hypothetical protein
LESPRAQAETFLSIAGQWKGEQNQGALSISQAGKKLWVHGLGDLVRDMWFEKPDLIKGAWGGNPITGQLSENGNRLDILYWGTYRRADPAIETAEQKAARAKEEEALRAIIELETYQEELNKADTQGSKYESGEALATASKQVGGSINCPGHLWCGWYQLEHYSAPQNKLFRNTGDVPNQAAAAIGDSIAYLNEARAVDGGALKVMRSQMAEWRTRKDTLFNLMDQLAKNWGQQTVPGSGTDEEKALKAKKLGAESDTLSKEIASITSPITSMRATRAEGSHVAPGGRFPQDGPSD